MRLLACSFFFSVAALGCGSAANGFTGGAGGSVSSVNGAGATSTTSSSGVTLGSGGAGAGGASSGGSTATGTSTGTSTSSSSSSSGSTDGGSDSWDCADGSDCPSGKCVAVTPGGFQVCLVPPVKATSCTAGILDQCCPTTPQTCPDQETCDVGPLVPICGGALMPPHNQCAVAQCAKDVDCAPGQICAPAGTLGLGVNACVTAHCKVDADCSAHPGGICAPVQNPCCAATSGLFCDYPGNGGCRSSADCPSTGTQPSRFCSPDDASGTAYCQTGGPVCPATMEALAPRPPA